MISGHSEEGAYGASCVPSLFVDPESNTDPELGPQILILGGKQEMKRC